MRRRELRHAARRGLAHEQAAAQRRCRSATVHAPSIRASRPGIESKRRSSSATRNGAAACGAQLRPSTTPKRAPSCSSSAWRSSSRSGLAQRSCSRLRQDVAGRRTSHCGWSTCAGRRIGSSDEQRSARRRRAGARARRLGRHQAVQPRSAAAYRTRRAGADGDGGGSASARAERANGDLGVMAWRLSAEGSARRPACRAGSIPDAAAGSRRARARHGRCAAARAAFPAGSAAPARPDR